MYGRAGGISVVNWASPLILNNLICNNSATERGGGVSIFSYSNPEIINNTIYGNTAGVEEGGIRISWFSYPHITDCIIWGNDPDAFSQIGYDVQYSNVQGGYPGLGNFSENPLFVDPENGDYHLKSTTGSFHGGAWLPDSQHSPCIDVGDPTSIYEIEPLPNGDRINIGAFGNTEEASLSFITAVEGMEQSEFCNFALFAYPNPFNPSTVISYELRVASSVSLTVFDVHGREVVLLVNGWRDTGLHQAVFDATGLSSGIYFARIESPNSTAQQKLVYLK